MNAKLCPNCNEYHNELESFNMRSTHENDLSKRKEDEMERRRKIREEQQIHMQLLKEEEDRLQKIQDDIRARKKLREANTIVVNSKKFLTIKTKKVQAFKEGRGKGSLLLKYRRGVNPFRRKKG